MRAVPMKHQRTAIAPGEVLPPRAGASMETAMMKASRGVMVMRVGFGKQSGGIRLGMERKQRPETHRQDRGFLIKVLSTVEINPVIPRL